VSAENTIEKRLAHVHKVVAGDDPKISDDITQATAYLRTFVAKADLPPDERPAWDPPDVFNSRLLTENRFQALGGRTPLTALREIVDAERLEARRAPKKKVDLLVTETEVFDAKPPPRKRRTPRPRTPYRRPAGYTPPPGSIRRSLLLWRFEDFPGALTILRDLPFSHGGSHGKFHDEKTAMAALTDARDIFLRTGELPKRTPVRRKSRAGREKTRGAESGKPTRAARAERNRRTFTPSEGFVSRGILLPFPGLPDALAAEALRLVPTENGGIHGRYHEEAAATAALTAARDVYITSQAAKEQIDPRLARSTTLADEYDISRSTVERLLAGLSTTSVNGAGHYDRTQAHPILDVYYAQKQTKEGIFIRNKKKYVTLNYLYKTYGASYQTLRVELAEIDTLKEGAMTLYPLIEVLKKLDHLIDIPRVNKTTGIYKDPYGKQWAPYTVIAQLLGVSFTLIEEHIDGLPTTEVRARNGQITDVYNVDSVRRRVAAYLAAPALQPEATDDDSQIVGTDYLHEKTGLPRTTIRKVLGRGTRIRGAGRLNGHPKAAAIARLEAFKAMPEIGFHTGEHIAPNGNVFVLKNVALKRLGITDTAFSRIIGRGNITQMTGRRGTGEFDIYSLQDLELACNK
jgi:hypothetical protein